MHVQCELNDLQSVLIVIKEVLLISLRATSHRRQDNNRLRK